MKKLSVVLATYNEEKNIRECLESVRKLADEIVVVDGSSSDKTVEIAREYGAKIIVTDNPQIFHINKQKALAAAKNEWILQLDADERLSLELSDEIRLVIGMDNNSLERYQMQLPGKDLFLRHQSLLEKRDGKIGGKNGTYNAFFIPRRNFFLGKFLTYGGVYPDGVIRLVKNGKAYFPAKDVHEQIVVDGNVGWLQNDLLHIDSPTFSKYITRWKRYVALMAKELAKTKTSKGPITGIRYLFYLPIQWFLLTYIRHKGFLDGWQGFVFSFFSSLRFAAAYLSYLFRK